MKFTPLPHYPSVRSRSTLPPSQLSALKQNISTALNYLLSLPSTTYLATSSITYISSYAKDYAAQVLDSLVWESNAASRIDLNFDKVERDIHRNTLYLAEKVAYSLDFQTLVDLSIVYGPSHSNRIRCLFELAFSKNPVLAGQVQREAVPAFVDLLRSSESGMYGLRKLSHIILSALRPSPPACLRIFAQNISFILALARPYHEELTAITHTYGGFRLPSHDNQLDDWQRIFLETKVSLIDAFHILVCYLFKDVATPQSATSTDDAFRFVFALVDLPPPTNLQDTLPTPFLNQSLLSDYEHAYDLSRTVAKVLHQANDPRTISLENTLQSIDSSEEGPGALKLLLRSSGIPPGIDNLGKGQSSTQVVAGSKGKGKAKDTSVAVEYDTALDTAVSQVLDILPEQDPDYVRYLLSHTDYPFKGNAERLIEAIFEGTAPPPEEVAAAKLQVEKGNNGEEFQYTGNRRNVFDEEDMDLNKVRIGKKAELTSDFLRDRTFMRDMKSNILQRAEAAFYADEDEVDELSGLSHVQKAGRDVAFEDEDGIDEGSVIHIRDGADSEEDEDSSDDDAGGDDGDAGESPILKDPETILELAYIRDPKLFDRDQQTRRSKNRADLKTQTGWGDEQIEGWKIMLERNPAQRDRILQKHEFSGNQRGTIVQQPPHQPQSSNRGRGSGRGGRGGSRGAGGGQGRGGGRGRGQRGGRGGAPGREGGSASNEDSIRGRAWKDKNKAREGNHDRKRGHDKKMTRMGGPS